MIRRSLAAAHDCLSARHAGQGLLEYGFIISLVAVVAISGLLILGPKLAGTFIAIGSSV